MTEMHLNARYIANAVPLPVIADADNGYGNAINVIRTVREYIQTGVAGDPHRGPGDPQALRPRGRAPGDPDRRGGRQVPRRRRGARRARPGLRPRSPAPTRGAPTAAASTRPSAAPTPISPRAPTWPSWRGRRASTRSAASARRSRGRSSTTRPASRRASRMAEMRDLGIAIAILPGALLRADHPGRLRPRASRSASAGPRRRPSFTERFAAIRWATCTRSPASTRSGLGGGVPARRGAREVRGLRRPPARAER